MADEKKESMFGRKVFFLSPTYAIRNDVIPQLQDMEFEVYIVEKLNLLKPLLRHFPDSICLINIGMQMPVAAWYMYVNSFKDDLSLAGISLGVFSDQLGDAERALFLDRMELPAGVIATNTSSSELLATFNDILTMNNAKGRRQYVRANCMADKNASMLWMQNGRMYQMKLIDISVAGAALMLPLQKKGLVQEKTVIHNATLRLGKKQLGVDFLVYAIHQKGDALLLVTLFLPSLPSATKFDIKDYINEILQKLVLTAINGERLDETDYISMGKAFVEEQRTESEIKQKEAELAKKDAGKV